MSPAVPQRPYERIPVGGGGADEAAERGARLPAQPLVGVHQEHPLAARLLEHERGYLLCMPGWALEDARAVRPGDFHRAVFAPARMRKNDLVDDALDAAQAALDDNLLVVHDEAGGNRIAGGHGRRRPSDGLAQRTVTRSRMPSRARSVRP